MPSELKCSESRENRDEFFSHTKDTKQSAYSRQKLLKVTPTFSVSLICFFLVLNCHADKQKNIIKNVWKLLYDNTKLYVFISF